MRKVSVGMVVVLLCGLAAASYSGRLIMVQSTSVNANGVRFIEASEIVPPDRVCVGPCRALRFTFECNADQASCRAPEVDAAYRIHTEHPHLYKCDNYVLSRAGDKVGIAVCLDNVD